ncbi:hypothetical protein [Ornithinimicrobium sediminis]|uniref:hypothetical protein n=1 Tax=Ornithinimicrobium sediminis TaxID=2904603 RepID=UPI001E4D2EFD|nr:hypothetical protein [Ornithinimicrobium sediminis]MCE0488264.1 hypothetical protein [Ornithinimicrobium sediminis]
MTDATEWAMNPTGLQMASSYDGDYTAVVSADNLDLGGWYLIAVLPDGDVVDEAPWEREARWASWTVSMIEPAWTADAEFRDRRAWTYALRSPDGETFPLVTALRRGEAGQQPGSASGTL